ncbi:type 4a pilus biogenesis protein PilO [Desulfoprunum benzoelyticum]|uniref:General secretion pathway protein M n=1 Tax=Desulfoprunum benzoelyticum TaxID=1506996 RepID=A0A840UNK1_9BACT|nr:general secretion pathway protein M [Desulfoprunum benzoelyticum]MBM9530766.1 type 4a pilus biogenesis protein PilO [Desulfoprunum benzoelyticum]
MLGVSIFLLLFLVYQLLLSPYVDARARLQHSVQQRQKDLEQIQKLRQDYLLIKKREGGIRDRLAKRSRDFALFTYVDRMADQAKIKDTIQYMKPSVATGEGSLQESLVELKLQGTTLEGLVNFLKLVESTENVVSLRRLAIQENGKTKGYIDVTMQIVTYTEKAGA